LARRNCGIRSMIVGTIRPSSISPKRGPLPGKSKRANAKAIIDASSTVSRVVATATRTEFRK